MRRLLAVAAPWAVALLCAVMWGASHQRSTRLEEGLENLVSATDEHGHAKTLVASQVEAYLDQHPLPSEAQGLLSTARILPVFESGEMIGLHVDAIRDGSPFAQAGLRSGDRIIRVGELDLDEPSRAARALQL